MAVQGVSVCKEASLVTIENYAALMKANTIINQGHSFADVLVPLSEGQSQPATKFLCIQCGTLTSKLPDNPGFIWCQFHQIHLKKLHTVEQKHVIFSDNTNAETNKKKPRLLNPTKSQRILMKTNNTRSGLFIKKKIQLSNKYHPYNLNFGLAVVAWSIVLIPIDKH
jgi:hypothetical protein